MDHFDDLLKKAAPPKIEVTPNFDRVFWEKIASRQKEPWFVRGRKWFEASFPVPSFSEAVAVFLIAFVVGGAGGVFSGVRSGATFEAEKMSVRYLSGFQEFKGVPSSSVAGSYLKTLNEEV